MVGYNADSPQEYLEMLEEDWRKEKLLELRQMVMKLAPEFQELISYKMLGFGQPGQPMLHLNAQKAYVGLYVGDIERVDPDGTLLAGINQGKGCVRFKKKDAVGPNVEQFLSRYIELKRRGEVLG